MNNPEDVRELQNYLRTISRYKNSIPLIVIDGIYGEETKEAVKEFQRQNSLPVTGIVDERTWDAIYLEYLQIAEATDTPVCIEAFPSADFILSPGAVGEEVYFLQLMLIALGNKFDNIPKLPLNGKYEKETIDAVKKFQEKTGKETNGETDNLTWNDIARAYNVHSKTIYPKRFS